MRTSPRHSSTAVDEGTASNGEQVARGERGGIVEERERKRDAPDVPFRLRSSFFTAFPRAANRVKANVPETKLDPADPPQLEFRFTRKPSGSPAPCRSRYAPLSCLTPRSTLRSPFEPAFFFGIYLTSRTAAVMVRMVPGEKRERNEFRAMRR